MADTMSVPGLAARPWWRRRFLERGAELIVLALLAVLTALLVVPAGWLDDLRGCKADKSWPT